MERDFIIIKISKNRFRKIFINDIIYCKADRIYSIIKTIDSEVLYTKPLKELEQLFKNFNFIRVNRSYFVNISKCIELKTGKIPELLLENGETIKANTDCLQDLEELFKTCNSEAEKRYWEV